MGAQQLAPAPGQGQQGLFKGYSAVCSHLPEPAARRPCTAQSYLITSSAGNHSQLLCCDVQLRSLGRATAQSNTSDSSPQALPAAAACMRTNCPSSGDGQYSRAAAGLFGPASTSSVGACRAGVQVGVVTGLHAFRQRGGVVLGCINFRESPALIVCVLCGDTQVGVLNWFARLWEIDEQEYWGYITNCGTEGNLHGILVGRENFPDGVLYASRETHYSVFKAARMYRMDAEKVRGVGWGGEGPWLSCVALRDIMAVGMCWCEAACRWVAPCVCIPGSKHGIVWKLVGCRLARCPGGVAAGSMDAEKVLGVGWGRAVSLTFVGLCEWLAETSMCRCVRQHDGRSWYRVVCIHGSKHVLVCEAACRLARGLGRLAAGSLVATMQVAFAHHLADCVAGRWRLHGVLQSSCNA